MADNSTFSPRLARLIGFGLIGVAWALLLPVLLLLVLSYGIYSDLRASQRSHWTSGTWADVVAWQLYTAHYQPIWSSQMDSVDFDDPLVYVPRPGVSRLSAVEFDTTIHITPGRARAQPPAPADARFVVMAGDSFTMGVGAQDDETFSYVLQQTYGYHTVNTGVASYGTARELARLRKMGLLTGIDALVIQYCENDLSENEAYLKRPDGYFGYMQDAKQSWDMLHDYRPEKCTYWSVAANFFTLIRARIKAAGLWGGIELILAEKPVPFGRLSNRQSADLGGKRAADFLAVLAKFPELKDTPIVVTEMSAHAGYTGFIEALRELAKDHPNIIPVSIRYTASDFFRFDMHLNPQGNRTSAAQLDAALKPILAKRKPVVGAAALHPGY